MLISLFPMTTCLYHIVQELQTSFIVIRSTETGRSTGPCKTSGLRRTWQDCLDVFHHQVCRFFFPFSRDLLRIKPLHFQREMYRQHTMASENNIIRVIVAFQIESNAARSSDEDTDSNRFVSPAAMIVAAALLGILHGTSLINVLRAICWPTATDVAFGAKLALSFGRLRLRLTHPPSCQEKTVIVEKSAGF